MRLGDAGTHGWRSAESSAPPSPPSRRSRRPGGTSSSASTSASASAAASEEAKSRAESPRSGGARGPEAGHLEPAAPAVPPSAGKADGGAAARAGEGLSGPGDAPAASGFLRSSWRPVQRPRLTSGQRPASSRGTRAVTDSADAIRAAFERAGLASMLPPAKSLARALVLSPEEEAAAWEASLAAKSRAAEAQAEREAAVRRSIESRGAAAAAAASAAAAAAAAAKASKPKSKKAAKGTSKGTGKPARPATAGRVASKAAAAGAKAGRPASASAAPGRAAGGSTSAAAAIEARGVSLPGVALERHPFPELRDALGLGTKPKPSGKKKKKKATKRATAKR